MGKILEFKNKNAEIDRLDELQRRLGNDVVDRLKEKLGQDVAVSYLNLGRKEGRGYQIHIYDNKYDFKTVSLNFIEIEETESYTDVDIYIEIIEKALEEGKYTTYKSTENERGITEIIESYSLSNIHILNGYLFSDDLYCGELALGYITSYKLDETNNTLTMYEDDANEPCEYIIDLETGHILELVDGKVMK